MLSDASETKLRSMLRNIDSRLARIERGEPRTDAADAATLSVVRCEIAAELDSRHKR